MADDNQEKDPTQDPDGVKILATALLQIRTLLKDLDPVLGAVALAQGKAADRVIEAIYKAAESKDKSGDSILKPILDRLNSFAKDLTRRDSDVIKAVRANQTVLDQLGRVARALSALELVVDMTPLQESLDNINSSLRKVGAIKFEIPLEATIKKLPAEALRVAVSLSDSDIAKIARAAGGAWQVNSWDQNILPILTAIKELLEGDISIEEAPATDGEIDNTTVAATSTEVVPADEARKAITITNPSLIDVWLAEGPDAELNKGIYLKANGGAHSIAGYTGPIHAIAAGGDPVITWNTVF